MDNLALQSHKTSAQQPMWLAAATLLSIKAIFVATGSSTESTA